jgi:periplasmic protein CpxP/Spy
MTRIAKFVTAGGLACGLLIAASSDLYASAPQLMLAQAAAPMPAPAPPQNVEANISSLHQRLQITPAQEPQFSALANVMRQNARVEESAPQAPPANASAVDYLRAEIQYDEMELAGLKRFLPALEALYATLSPTQRQTANGIFREGPGG